MYRVHLFSRCLGLCLLLVQTVPCNADFDAGWNAYGRGDFPAAFREWQTSAEQGDARAEANLAYLYAEGHGVPQDCQKAVYWFEKAAAQGSDHARYGLGVFYYSGRCVSQDLVKAYMWFNLAAASGSLPVAERARDDVGARLTQGQLAKAQELARDNWPASSASAPEVAAATPAVQPTAISADSSMQRQDPPTNTRPAVPTSATVVQPKAPAASEIPVPVRRAEPTVPDVTAPAPAPATSPRVKADSSQVAPAPPTEGAPGPYSLADAATKAEEIAHRYALGQQSPALPSGTASEKTPASANVAGAAVPAAPGLYSLADAVTRAEEIAHRYAPAPEISTLTKMADSGAVNSGAADLNKPAGTAAAPASPIPSAGTVPAVMPRSADAAQAMPVHAPAGSVPSATVGSSLTQADLMLGSTRHQKIAASTSFISYGEIYDRLRRVFDVMSSAGGLQSASVGRQNLFFLDDPEVNAFSAGGGRIYVTRGIMQVVGSSDGMLAFVLAHEMAHNSCMLAAQRYLRAVEHQRMTVYYTAAHN